MYPMATMQLSDALKLIIVKRMIERKVPHMVILQVMESIDVAIENEHAETQATLSMVDKFAFMKP